MAKLEDAADLESVFWEFESPFLHKVSFLKKYLLRRITAQYDLNICSTRIIEN